MNIVVRLSMFVLIGQHISQPNYIGGNNVNFIGTNPSFVNQYMERLTGQVTEACKSIPGIGAAALSIKQAQ